MARQKVVVIEGDEEARYLYNIALEFQNLNVLSAPTFREGLELTKEIKPDLILIDQTITDFENYDIMKELSAATNDNLPAIIITNLSEKSHRSEEVLRVIQAFEYLVVGKNSVGDVIRSSRKAINI